MNLSRLHWPVTALGPGRRAGIWFQGCSIGCKDCCSRDTWVAGPEHAVPISDVIQWVAQRPSSAVEGFTISGGEPFDQPDALLALIAALRALPSGPTQPDILIYSGYPWKRLAEQHAAILALADAVISEPFVNGRPADALRGSANQQMHLLSDLARKRYAAWQPPEPRQMQSHFDGQVLWMIGIPRPGDLERIRSRLGSAGVVVEGCSWLA